MFCFHSLSFEKMPLETLIFQYLLIIYTRFNQSKMLHLKKYWVTISVNILNIPKRMENGFSFCQKKLFHELTKYDFSLIKLKMFMWPLQTHFCLLSSYVYVSKTCTRTSYSLWMLVEFGNDLRFFPPMCSHRN